MLWVVPFTFLRMEMCNTVSPFAYPSTLFLLHGHYILIVQTGEYFHYLSCLAPCCTWNSFLVIHDNASLSVCLPLRVTCSCVSFKLLKDTHLVKTTHQDENPWHNMKGFQKMVVTSSSLTQICTFLGQMWKNSWGETSSTLWKDTMWPHSDQPFTVEPHQFLPNNLPLSHKCLLSWFSQFTSVVPSLWVANPLRVNLFTGFA